MRHPSPHPGGSRPRVLALDARAARQRALVLAGLLTLALAAVPSLSRAAEPAPVEQLVVGFRAGTPSALRTRALAGAGVSAGRPVPGLAARVVTVPLAEAAETLALLRATPGVAYAERDAEAYVAATGPNDPLSRSGWQLELPRFPLAWDLSRGSPDVTIAIVDTGVYAKHPDLQGVVAGYDFVNMDSRPSDDHGHGTMVAGVAAARAFNGRGVAGVCWRCSIMPVKVLSKTGAGSWSQVAAGIVWAADHGADVINLSLGGTSRSNAVEAAVAHAREKDVVVVAAAGNNGSEQSFYPAAYEGVVSVAASEEHDYFFDFSNRGEAVDVAAPGCAPSTQAGGGYVLSVCGTSIASPFVAGLAGLARAAAPAATAEEIEAALAASEEGVLAGSGASTSAAASGLTRIDARATLEALGVGETAPASLIRPSVKGRVRVGSVLRVGGGRWSGTGVTTSVTWQRCSRTGTACRTLAGRTDAAYRLRRADRGRRIRAVVTAVSLAGQTERASALTKIVRR